MMKWNSPEKCITVRSLNLRAMMASHKQLPQINEIYSPHLLLIRVCWGEKISLDQDNLTFQRESQDVWARVQKNMCHIYRGIQTTWTEKKRRNVNKTKNVFLNSCCNKKLHEGQWCKTHSKAEGKQNLRAILHIVWCKRKENHGGSLWSWMNVRT